jgi:vacuolar-type H+-ATPase subunit I/STV1
MRQAAAVTDAERRSTWKRLPRIAALPAAWAIPVATILWTATWPDTYLSIETGLDQPVSYPAFDVAQVILWISLEIALVTAVLRPSTYLRSWTRAFGAFAVSLGFLLYFFPWAFHAAPYRRYYVQWLTLFALAMLILLAWSAVANFGRWRQGRMDKARKLSS